jgi:hypothetical protein
VIHHGPFERLGWDSDKNPPGCNIWNEAKKSIRSDLHTFLKELEEYQEKVKTFPGIATDLLETVRTKQSKNVCDTIKLQHPDGLPGIFKS